MSANEKPREHGYCLENRKRMVLRGVRDADGFDDRRVTLLTDCGAMNIQGDGLHVLKLDLDAGLAVIEGRVDSVSYEKERDARGLFERLFG